MSLYDKLNKPNSGLSEITAGTTDANQNTNMKGFGNKIQAGDELLGRKVTKLSLELKNNGSAVGGTITFGVFNTNSATPVFTFGTFSASELTSSYQYFEEENLTGHTLTADQVLGFHASGDISNLQLRRYNGGTGGRPTVYAMYWATSSSPNWQNAGDNQDANMKVTYIIPSVKVSGATFEDDYTSNTGWTQTGSKVTVNSGKSDWVDANAPATNDSLQQVIKSLGITLSDTAWTADFTYINNGGTVGGYPFVFQSGTGNYDSASNDAITMSEDNPNKIKINTKNGGTYVAGSSTIAVGSGTTYYIRLQRTSATDIKLSAFTDSARTTHASGSPVTASNAGIANITGLTYVQHQNQTSGGGGTTNFEITDLKIYNNSTSAIPDSEVGILRQRFVETFSGDTLDTDRWKMLFSTGTSTATMSDSIDGGLIVSTTAGANHDVGVSFNTTTTWDSLNIRNFAHNSSVYIDVFKQNGTSSAHKVIVHGMGERIRGDGAGNNASLWGSGVNMNTNYFMSRTCASNGSQSDTASDVAYDQNWHNYKIENKSASVEYTLDGVLKTTITTNLPASRMAPLNGAQANGSVSSYSIRYVECYNT